MSQTINIKAECPPLPEGWVGTPDQLLEFFKANATFVMDGAIPVGQVGGARPTEDVGLYYSDNSIEKWRTGKYQPITDIPIGAGIPWFSSSPTIPDNYLLCNGASLLRAEEAYQELYAAIGTTYGSESGTTFNLPDMRGRVPIGAGTGDYTKQGIATGKMRTFAFSPNPDGPYVGFEWPKNRTVYGNPPPIDQMTFIKDGLNGALEPVTGSRYVSAQNPAVVCQWIIRYR